MIVAIGSLLRGLVGGAAVMYFCDPRSGRRRRARVVDQFRHLTHETETLWDKGSRDLMNRSRGWQAEAKSFVVSSPVGDEQLAARVRSKLGHLVSDARSVQVAVQNGTVTLRGHLRPGETERVIPALESLPGVRAVESGIAEKGEPIDEETLAGSQLAPGNRLLLATGGSALFLNGLMRRGFGPFLLSKLGLYLMIRGLSDRPVSQRGLGRLIGFDLRPRGIRVQKGIRIAAPVEKVFDLIADVEQSHRFRPMVSHVETIGQGRHRWTLKTPVGELTFEEQVTDLVPNERLVLESTPDAPARYCEEVRFRSEGEYTIVTVDLLYFPPAGRVGHAAAAFFGLDPKSQLDDGLNRIKLQLEQGILPHSLSDPRNTGSAAGHEQSTDERT